MSKQRLIAVPNPDRSGRWSVYDPVLRAYVSGAVNVPRQQAEKLAKESEPADWQSCARRAGWLPPEEIERALEEVVELSEQAEQASPPPGVQGAEPLAVDALLPPPAEPETVTSPLGVSGGTPPDFDPEL